MQKCYLFKNETIDSFRNSFTYSSSKGSMYYIDFDMVTCEFADVESRIVTELQNFKEKICNMYRNVSECSNKIHGPVYVLVLQSPYYRATQAENIQYPLLMPNTSDKKEKDVCTPSFVYVQILLPHYNKNGTHNTPAVDYLDAYYLPEWNNKYVTKGSSTCDHYELKQNDDSPYGTLYQINKSYALFTDIF